ncbi:hypothetical protein TetV_175 [Tetraselmis virus 1]|uniref:Uncharacterized protein n=1 Tax=Tetraselmis virus 1 TaxID=2060617 RepID=A0A2P0VMY0_9VIRU|nr:hypothetical protein QJ968_gp175 [Tetraselmis virus 1]AUF82267.1 hypothetical protein TetV_175 [Tetraselmis virus 1]
MSAMSSSGTPMLVQHLNHLAARIQAVVHKVDALSEELEELRQNSSTAEGSLTSNDLTNTREDIKRDIIRERAMMEASIEHRIDQQVGKLLTDPCDNIAKLEGRMDALENVMKASNNLPKPAPVKKSKKPAAVSNSMDLDSPVSAE